MAVKKPAVEQQFYRLNQILATKADYLMLLGERSNGKSYATKECILWEAYHECDYEKYINSGAKVPKDRWQFGYLRRWKEETKTRDVEKYFADMDIMALTDGEYDTVVAYRSDIYFGNFIDDGKVERGKQIGSIFAVTSRTHYKSLSFLKIGNIVFEEFITNTGYLPDEVGSLMDIVSTIARRDYVRVFLIGNTISRLCPYFDEWQLTHVAKQKQGTVEIYKQPTEQIDEATGEHVVVTIAVEYCANNSKNTKMFFGSKSNMITSGVWECEIHPHLQNSFKSYECKYKVYYEYSSFRYVICLLRDENKNPFLYIYPAKNVSRETYCADNKIRRIITDQFTTEPYATPYLTALTRYDNIIIDLLLNEKLTFSDNLTGTEFYQVKKERGRW